MNHDIVKEYYGKTLSGSSDLKTDACATTAAPPRHVREALALVHHDVASRYYGCGLVLPSMLSGLRILDLGCGAGRDVFALSKLVGPDGFVVGVDMTEEQLAVARAHEKFHAERFGYKRPNTRFIDGYLEDLGALGLEPASFDVIVSNCVINLCTDKEAVFTAAHALLKPGGEMYFSDIYADRRAPDALVRDPALYSECLSGALYWGDFQKVVRASGFGDPRVVEHRPVAIGDPDLAERARPIRFASVTARLFKLGGLEPACEDYGQAVVYRGGVLGMERIFTLDAEHRIEQGRVFPVCGNTAAMLTRTRFAPHFDLIGEGATHLGLFPGCSAPDVFVEAASAAPAAAGGCC